MEGTSGIDPIEGGCVVLDRREKVDGCLATFCGPANINVYWYFCVMHNYLYSLVVFSNTWLVPRCGVCLCLGTGSTLCLI
jgi:hypothetical protein